MRQFPKRMGLSYVINYGPHTSIEMVRAAVLAEKCGFEAVFVPEHYYDREASSILGALSQVTSRIQLGTGVINPYTRYPSLIAMMAATLSELSNGRFFLGLGSGGVIGSLHHGIPSELKGQVYSHPLGHMREITKLVRSLINGECVTFDGRFYNLNGVKLNFRVNKRNIPIYFGQQSPRMMKLAGEIADGVIITLCCSIQYVRRVVQIVEKSRQEAKRPENSIDFAARIVTSISNNEKEAIDKARLLVARVLVHPGAKSILEESKFDINTVTLKEMLEKRRISEVRRMVSDELVQATTACGTKQQVLERIEEYRRAGVDLPLIVPIDEEYDRIIKLLSPI